MAFTALDVKTLREMTGVGMMDCKKALVETDGDQEKAIDWLREKGMAAQTKKAGKITAEGVAYATVSEAGVGVVVEVNSQTDFVAKNEVFQEFVRDIASVIADKNPADIDVLQEMTYPGTDRTIAAITADKILSIGENLKLRRFVRYTEGVSVPYIHMGGKIGVMVNMAVEGIDNTDAVVALGKDIAMQIAAMYPLFLDKSEVDSTTLDREHDILMVQAKEENKLAAKPKPDAIIEKMVQGRISKYYEENCLLQQAFVKENKTSVGAHVAAVAKNLGGTITVTGFTRFQAGEGIEKKEDDFAAEVASMIK